MTIFDKLFSPKIKKSGISDIEYVNIPTNNLSVEQLEQCANLFSQNYGNYSQRSSRRPGEQVRMGINYYRKNYIKDDYSVALAMDCDTIIGQAFYIRKKYDNKIMTWVVQLVVDRDYRQQGIASTLLRSIWGFSDDYAWGLATANPCTVRTLESATMRKCKPSVIKDHQRDIYKIGKDIGFVDEGTIEVSNISSQINTDFDVDNSGFEHIEEYERRLGKLKHGREWLAFTFQNQGIQADIYAKKFPELIKFSEKQLKEAYDRMPIERQLWAKGTRNEVSYIMKYATDNNIQEVIDLGCGVGRHSIEIARQGINATGIDFSARHIEYARKKARDNSVIGCEFVCGDVRSPQINRQYDMAICLYDVIGSFPNLDDNIQLIRSANRLIKSGGLFIISVMNMELTEAIVPKRNRGDVMHDSDLLLKLKPSVIMQSTGNVFDPNYMIIDEPSGLVYRKEQFADDNQLSAEYVIRDKRYTMKEIVGLVENEGFRIIDKRYVRAGHFDEQLGATDSHAKEILITARKSG